MALTVDQAQAIVDAVSKDPAAREQVESWLAFLPDSWGAAGWIRNFGFALVNTYTGKLAADSPWVEKRVCTGIAAAGVEAIEKSLPGGVKKVHTVDRFDPAHTATQVDMNDESSYVFDWHATLNVENPMIFPSVSNWQTLKKGGVTLANFEGFP